MRPCSKCGEDKPPEDFRKVSPGKGRKDGLHSWCRGCERTSGLKRYWADHDENIVRQRASYARHRDKRRAEMREYHAQNRERRITQMAEWREANPETMRKAKKRWRQNNPDKAWDYSRQRWALKKNAPEVESIDRQAIYDRDSGRCHICDKKVPRSSFELDHLIPLSKGGPHTAANLAVAHKSCNCRRHDGKLPAQLLLVG